MSTNIVNQYPEWLKISMHDFEKIETLHAMLKGRNLHTVCEEANCPNAFECFSKQTATFMILGRHCTRNCKFCNVINAAPMKVEPSEPGHVAAAVKEMALKYVVVTSVTRDDLADGGAEHFADVIKAIREISDSTQIEVLIPDFQGNVTSLQKVINAEPEVINHNIETVSRLYEHVRPEADYQQSLKLLQNVKMLSDNILTKSGLMVGLGETQEEVEVLLRDLKDHQCDIVTIGQYLPPTSNHYPLHAYVEPDRFEYYKKYGEALGIPTVIAGPLVRSSYKASEALSNLY